MTLLDAKYRELWEKQLPREMLYQLVVYAISQKATPRSCILYPTNNPRAKEARINVAEPIAGTQLGQVCLRPVNLESLAMRLRDDSADNMRWRFTYAAGLAFGE